MWTHLPKTFSILAMVCSCGAESGIAFWGSFMYFQMAFQQPVQVSTYSQVSAAWGHGSTLKLKKGDWRKELQDWGGSEGCDGLACCLGSCWQLLWPGNLGARVTQKRNNIFLVWHTFRGWIPKHFGENETAVQFEDLPPYSRTELWLCWACRLHFYIACACRGCCWEKEGCSSILRGILGWALTASELCWVPFTLAPSQSGLTTSSCILLCLSCPCGKAYDSELFKPAEPYLLCCSQVRGF